MAGNTKKPRKRYNPHKIANLPRRIGLDEARRVMQPLRNVLVQLQGDVIEYDGKLLTHDTVTGDYFRADYTFIGWADCFDALFSQPCTESLRAMADKLGKQEPIYETDLLAVERSLDVLQAGLSRLDANEVRRKMLTHQISIEVQAHGLGGSHG